MERKVKVLVAAFVKVRSSIQETCLWDKPLVAYADADDPLFKELKTVVSPDHNLPKDILADARTVISYFIPFSKEIIKSNTGGKVCSKEWALAYIETNRLISDLNNYLSFELGNMGFHSSPVPPTHNFSKKTLLSNWSHRHIAFIAGLGGFGLNRMLITEKGCCGRLGSIVTNAKLEPTIKKQKEYCLYYAHGTCGKCIDNCVFKALKKDSFDRHKCYRVCLENSRKSSSIGLADACGKCICGVPCSFCNPVK